MTPSPLLRAALAIAAGMVTAGLTTTGFATRAHAQNYPWCLQSDAYEGGENCGFTSFDQCMATRHGIGGFCQVNTQYQAGVSPMPSPRRSPKARPGKPS
jgi:Protein of unknown function (DUF3551)